MAERKSIVRVGADESPIPSSKLLEKKILPGIDELIKIIKYEDCLINAEKVILTPKTLESLTEILST